jgi:hypothetical protein
MQLRFGVHCFRANILAQVLDLKNRKPPVVSEIQGPGWSFLFDVF